MDYFFGAYAPQQSLEFRLELLRWPKMAINIQIFRKRAIQRARDMAGTRIQWLDFARKPLRGPGVELSLIHISEPTRRACRSRMPSSA